MAGAQFQMKPGDREERTETLCVAAAILEAKVRAGSVDLIKLQKALQSAEAARCGGDKGKCALEHEKLYKDVICSGTAQQLNFSCCSTGRVTWMTFGCRSLSNRIISLLSLEETSSRQPAGS